MLRDAPVKTGASFEEYVAYEVTSDVRHEFIDGNVFVTVGGTKLHNLITTRAAMKLFEVALQLGCAVYSSDVILRVPSGKGFYPDVFVTCDSSMDSAQVVQRPCIIIEVLSTSTEIFDRREKWEQYQQIPALEQYVLLSQREIAAEVYSRQDSKWLYERFTGDAKLRFSSLEVDVSLPEFYEGIPELGQSEDD
jgi:Uma2 family endonuclease